MSAQLKKFLGYQFLMLFLIQPFSVFAATTDDADVFFPVEIGCFTSSARFTPKEQETVKVVLDDTNDLFFMQNGEPIPSRIYSYGSIEHLPYTITNAKGIDAPFDTALSLLADDNPQTDVRFDVYEAAPYFLTLDMGRVLPAGSFRLLVDHNSSYRIGYSLSRDNSEQVRVADPDDFEFRYLTIWFSLPISSDLPSEPLIVRDIRFVQPANNTYILNPVANTEVTVLSGYQCRDGEAYQRFLRELEKLADRENYAVDADTPLFEIDFEASPFANNDFDDDSIENKLDNCPFLANPEQSDLDDDLIGDVCDLDAQRKNATERDSDLDGVGDTSDNCPSVYNPQQADSNADLVGDLCADDDKDGVIGYRDNCIDVSNRDQKDINVNGVGDACEFDKDEDGVFDSIDNCITLANSDQRDTDKDGIGDVCDNCETYNPQQQDLDKSGIGDVCEEIQEVQELHDQDKDGILDNKDNCPEASNADQTDFDKDGIGDVCDNCKQLQNKDQDDKNENGIGDFCEDRDSDGFEGYLDNCEAYHNPDQKDADNDGIGDLCEDEDRDGIPAADDVCPQVKNPDQMDTDKDGIGDVCDDKDDRFLESNKLFVALVITVLSFTFLGLSFVLFSRLPK